LALFSSVVLIHEALLHKFLRPWFAGEIICSDCCILGKYHHAMEQQKANTLTGLVAGATGLVGKQLVNQLLQNQAFAKTVVFVRRTTGIVHPKLVEHVINFDEPAAWSHLLQGDILFSALGTTIRQAGSQQAQYRVDHTYQLNLAKAAATNGVSKYVLVSSVGANAASPFFYTRMKGELEEEVKKLPFRQVDILQPSLLDGDRQNKRPLEKFSIVATTLFNKLGLMKKYRPVKGAVVAAAMIRLALTGQPGLHIWPPASIHALGRGAVPAQSL